MRRKDFWSECYDRETPERTFRATFCNHCRNAQCALAGWSRDIFSQRVQQQEDLLFNPNRGQSQKPVTDFQSLLNKAVRLEIADRRGDWSLPEEPPKGFIQAVPEKNQENPGKNPEITHLAEIPPEPANKSAQEKINSSITTLLQQSKAQKKENIPRTKSSPVEWDEKYKSSESAVSNVISEETNQTDLKKQNAEINKSHSKNGVSAQRADDENEMIKSSRDVLHVPTSKPNVDQVASGHNYNTPLHWAGIMLGGDSKPEPQRTPTQKSMGKTKQQDPWQPKPKANFQEPGARIKLGGNNGKK